MSDDNVSVKFGRTELFCCEAQMYLHIVGQPSAVHKFCNKCNGEYVDPLNTPEKS